jgi:hypothetical protein
LCQNQEKQSGVQTRTGEGGSNSGAAFLLMAVHGASQEQVEAIDEFAVPMQVWQAGRRMLFQWKLWHRAAAVVNLRTLPLGDSRERCYMQELANCEGPISGEHLISKAVMQVLRGDGDFTISGLPWLDVGVEKKVGLNSLTAKCRVDGTMLRSRRWIVLRPCSCRRSANV